MPSSAPLEHRYKAPRGSLANMRRPPGGRKRGPKPLKYTQTPIPPSTPHRETGSSSSTPAPPSSSDQTTASYVRRVRGLALSDADDSASQLEESCPLGFEASNSNLSRPDLFDDPPANASVPIDWAKSTNQQQRFLHNVSEDDEESGAQVPWMPRIPAQDLPTPGLSRVDGFLQAPRSVDLSQHVTAHMPLDILPRHFDVMSHDYTKHKHGCSNKVSVEWLTPSGLTPANIRSRRIRLHLRNDNDRSHADRLVWKSEYRCNGLCLVEPTRKGTRSWKPEMEIGDAVRRAQQRDALERAGAELSSEGDEEATSFTPFRRPRCGSRLFVTVSVGQVALGLCSVMAKDDKYHPPAPQEHLALSPTIRDELHQTALQMGMTSARLRMWFYTTCILRNSHAAYLDQYAKHRLPQNDDAFNQAVDTVRKQQRTHVDPLLAIEHIALRNPELFIDFTHSGVISPPDTPAEEKAPLSCIIAPPYGLDNAILYGHANGIYMDSSWRNKNAHKAPMTVLATHDDYHRMVPIAVMISQHGKAAQYRRFLRKVGKAVKRRALSILGGTSTTKSEDEDGRMRTNMIEISEDGFVPPFVMIDGCDAERKAIDSVWPGIAKRVCQFHLMQAIKGMCRTLFGRSDAGAIKTQSTLEAIRACQRCPDERSWQEYMDILGARMRVIADDSGEVWTRFRTYLQSTWFSDRWRAWCVDYGIPCDAFRDGPWSTNNYVEATFRVFDRVLLCGRSNKRLDRLVVIIINYYFPFFQYLPRKQSRADPGFLTMLSRGFNCWQANGVQPVDLDSMMVPVKLRGRVRLVFGATSGPNEEVHFPHQVNGEAGQGRWMCTCDTSRKTGKQCEHLWASGILQKYGTIDSYEASCDAVRASVGDLPTTSSYTHTSIKSNEESESEGEDGEDNEEIGYASEDESGDELGLDDGFQEPLAGDDDKYDFEQYWGPGKMQTLKDLETIVKAVAITSRRNRTPQPEPSAESDTEDVAGSDDSDNQPPSPSPSGGKKLRPGHGLPPGPNPANRSLHPGRRKKTKSTLSLPTKLQSTLGRPVGIENTGDDCFGAALLQALVHHGHWAHAFDAAHTAYPLLRRSDLGAALHQVQSSLLSNRLAGFPNLNKTLSAAIGQGRGQHDPSEVLRGVIGVLDSLLGSPSFSKLFAVLVRRTFHCKTCDTWSEVAGPGGEYIEMICQALITKSTSEVPEMIKRGMSEGGSVATRTCTNSACTAFATSGLATTLRPTGDLLAVEVSSHTSSTSSDGSFKLKADMSLEMDEQIGSKVGARVHWKLTGIICFVGTDRASGHYCSMFLGQEGIWWLANDAIVTQAGSILDAFVGLRQPRLLLYTKLANSLEGVSTSVIKRPRHTPSPPNAYPEPGKPAPAPETSPKKARANQRPPQVEYDISDDRPIPEFAALPEDHSELPLRERPKDFQDPPRLALDLKVNAGMSPWFHRYSQIKWGNRRTKQSVFTAGLGVRKAMDNINMASLFDTWPNETAQHPVKDFRVLFDPEGWLSNTFMDSILRSLAEIRGPARVDSTEDVRAVYGRELFTWTTSPAGREVPSLCASTGPTPYLAGYADWRSLRTAGFFGAKHGTHWMAAIVFGPERLVVPFDGMGGQCMGEAVRSLWDTFVQRKLDYELRMGWVKPEDNMGWIVAPNTTETRKLIDWPEQTDTSSCGPLAMSAVSCALQGLKPTRQTLSVSGKWDRTHAVALRSSIAGWFFSHATQQGDRGRFKIDFVRGADGFDEYVQPWMLSAGEVEEAFKTKR